MGVSETMTASTDTQKKTMIPKWRYLLFALAGLLVLALAACGFTIGFGLTPLVVEAGEQTPAGEDFLTFPYAPLLCESDLTEEAYSEIGTHTVRFSFLGILREITLTVQDTTPPSFETKSHGVKVGEAVRAEDFFTDARDHSSYKAELILPDGVETAGEYTVIVCLRDAFGNESRKNATLYVYDIPEVLPLEAGAGEDACLAALQNAVPTAIFDGAVDTSRPGEMSATVLVDGFAFALTVRVQDTTPPTAQAKPLYLPSDADTFPAPADFLEALTDASEVEVSYASAPNFSLPGQRGVTLVLTDAAGNVSRIRARYTVAEPEKLPAPVIVGVKNISVNVGAWISYTPGVSATDHAGNSLKVQIDSSSVNRHVPGVYTVTYTAVDAFGTETAVQASVTVSEITETTLKPYVDKVLRKILRDGMTQREMARAIYDWMKANVSYTAYAAKDHWERAAYSGFTTGRGDCYVYYAMSRSLLNAAGIENLEICRDNPAKPHYWNLVNCGDGWYHFDTCPHYRQYPLESFMLTDAEVKAYSENCVKDYYSFDASLYPATP